MNEPAANQQANETSQTQSQPGQENNLRLLAFEQCPDGMVLASPDGQWQEVNPALCRLLDYSREQILTLSAQAMGTDPILPSSHYCFRGLIPGGAGQDEKEKEAGVRMDIWRQFQKRSVRRGGSGGSAYLSVTVSRLFGRSGKVIGLLGRFHNDSDERRRCLKVERRLEDARDQASSLLAAATAGRLVLCHDSGQLPTPLPHRFGEPLLLKRKRLHLLRAQVQAAASALGLSQVRMMDLVRAAHEAACNALIHGEGRGNNEVHEAWICTGTVGGSRAAVGSGAVDAVQVWVRDPGQWPPEHEMSILDDRLGWPPWWGGSYDPDYPVVPKGLWWMVQGCDRVWFHPGERQAGTVVLEVFREALPPDL